MPINLICLRLLSLASELSAKKTRIRLSTGSSRLPSADGDRGPYADEPPEAIASARSAQRRPSRLERLRQTYRVGERRVVAGAVTAVAVLLAVEVVQTAPPDAPIVAATFDVEPPAGPDTGRDESAQDHQHWAADTSAEGTRPDAIH